MIKKVNIDQLKPGLYISDFNCDWLNHPFLNNSLFIRNTQQIDRIREYGIREVYIDTNRGRDVDDAPTAAEAVKTVRRQLSNTFNTRPEFEKPEPLRNELKRAQRIKQEAYSIVQRFSDDIRLGKQLRLDGVEDVVDKMLDSVSRNKDALLSLINIRKKDQYTYMHSVSVGVLMIAFCKALGMSQDEIRKYGLGALMHDVGKMMIPLELINKPGKLTEEEYELMKRHVTYSYEILSENDQIPKEAIQIAYEHHERRDGVGYPRGLSDEAISRGGMMTAIVDVYDAITSVRSYSDGVEPIEALRKLFEWSKFHFDEDLVHKFIKTMGIYPVGSMVRLANNQLAVVVETGRETLLKPVVRVIYDIRRQIELSPRDVDLSAGMTEAHQILSSEPPSRWKLDPAKYLQISLS
jgi:putative nucleotidyltransferase with HDIG domain